MRPIISYHKVFLTFVFLWLALLSCIKTGTSQETTSPSPFITPYVNPTLPPAATSPLYLPPSAPMATPFVSPGAISPSPSLSPLQVPVQTPVAIPSAVEPDRIPSLEVYASGLEIPWSMEFAPDGRLFFTERTGRIRIMQQGRLLEEPVARINVAAAGEGGLLGLTLDPDFKNNNYLYIYYTYQDLERNLKNRVERLTFTGNRLRDPKILLDGIPGNRIHDGGRLKFGPDGKLYITTGDAGNSQLSQNRDSLAGKILRLNPDGSIPQDNPFPGSPVYSWGHRNPEGLAWHPETGVLFSTEHGSSAHDEINVIKAGANYGWPLVRGKESSPQLISPFLESGVDTWAPAGMAFYTGNVFPAWRENLFFTALRGESLHRIVLSGQEIARHEKLFPSEIGRLRDVIFGPDGTLYISTSNRDGRGVIRPDDDRIYRLVPAAR